MKQDFTQRSLQPELMDDGCESFAEFDACLQELETINHLTLAYRPTLAWLKQVTALRVQQPHTDLTILDVGSGGGDMLRKIRKAIRLPNLQLTGVDLNPWAAQSAHQATQQAGVQAGIHYETSNIFAFPEGKTFDFIISSLFTHHLNNDELVAFIRWMDAHAAGGWFINDLHRHWLPYYFIKAMTFLFSRNRLIRHDAAVSVARAFTRADWQALIARSGVDGSHIKITWCFPFRYVVSCQKR